MKFSLALAVIAACATAKNADKADKAEKVDKSKGANGEEYMEFVATYNKSFKNRDELAKSRGNWKKQTEDIFDLRAMHPET